MEMLLQNTELNNYIQKHESQWLASVCSGAFLLGQAGVLDGKQATTWFGGEADLQAQFPAIQVVSDKTVVVDNRRMSANGGVVAYQAALVLLAQLTSAEHARTVYESLSMDRLGSWDQIRELIAPSEQGA